MECAIFTVSQRRWERLEAHGAATWKWLDRPFRHHQIQSGHCGSAERLTYVLYFTDGGRCHSLCTVADTYENDSKQYVCTLIQRAHRESERRWVCVALPGADFRCLGENVDMHAIKTRERLDPELALGWIGKEATSRSPSRTLPIGAPGAADDR